MDSPTKATLRRAIRSLRLRGIVKQYVTFALIICMLVAIVLFWLSWPTANVSRAALVFVFAGCVLYGANEAVFTESAGNSDPLFVRYVIAYNSVMFIVVGLTALVLLCPMWEIPFLISGACLLVGGFFGLLFG